MTKKTVEEQMANERLAKGTKGTLMMLGGNDGTPIFRVYTHPVDRRLAESKKKADGRPYDSTAWEYRDYNLRHFDIDMIVDDESASFYDEENPTLDYSSAVRAIPE